MKEQEQTKWLQVLNQAELGDIININGLCVKVEEYIESEGMCVHCAFYRPNEDDYCGLNEGRGVTPCISGNNHLCKSLLFSKIEIND